MAHIPNVLRFDDFETLVVLLNYSELVLAVTPSRYSLPGFDKRFKLPRDRGREIRVWLSKHFVLTLEPPLDDADDDARLDVFLLTSLIQQAHQLTDDFRRAQELSVIGPEVDDGEDEITAQSVMEVITEDLSSFPSFKSCWKAQLACIPPSSYRLPAPPSGTSYVVKRKV